MSADCPEHERLFLGGLLVCVWSSLRWMDIQRCCPESLVIDGNIIRGNCWQTKTSQQGQPWGLIADGASGTIEGRNWGKIWFASLQTWVKTQESEIDYLIPDVDLRADGVIGSVLPRPMTYSCASACFRRLMGASWMGTAKIDSHQCASYTLHGLKATLLSWSRQLDVREDLRGDQGHHRSSSGRAAVSLYSRDDVWGALRCQDWVLSAIHSGFAL